MCGAACFQAQEGYPIEYEEVESVEIIAILKLVTFNDTVCEPPPEPAPVPQGA